MHQNRQDSDSFETQKIKPSICLKKSRTPSKKLVLVSWIDLQKAFDKVWMEGLLVKLLRNGIASNMFNRIKSYLYNHRASVSVDRVHSKKILLKHSVPQGGVLSLTSFLLFINDLVSELPNGFKAALYADDLVMWCKEEYATTVTDKADILVQTIHNPLTRLQSDLHIPDHIFVAFGCWVELTSTQRTDRGQLVVYDSAQISMGTHHLYRLAHDGNRLSLSVCWGRFEVYN